MSEIWTIAKREVFAFFVSPIAYVVLTVWLLFFGIVFCLLAFAFAQSPTGGANLLSSFFGGTTLFYLPLLVYAPLLTMRLLAEERSSGTIEPLLTAPVSEVSVVFGKFLAAMTFWVVLWIPTLSYVYLVARTGEHTVDWGAIGATYLGLFCVGLLYMSIGLLMSAIARNQIIAALLTFFALGVLFVVGILSFLNVGDDTRGIFEYVGLWTQMSAFAKGIVDTRYLTFDLTLTALALFTSVQVLSSNRGAQ